MSNVQCAVCSVQYAVYSKQYSDIEYNKAPRALQMYLRMRAKVAECRTPLPPDGVLRNFASNPKYMSVLSQVARPTARLAVVPVPTQKHQAPSLRGGSATRRKAERQTNHGGPSPHPKHHTKMPPGSGTFATIGMMGAWRGES